MGLKQRIDKRIQQVDQAVLLHFTPHYPKYHTSPFKIDCWCGTSFSSDCLDTRDLARMIEFFNDHAACAPKDGGSC